MLYPVPGNHDYETAKREDGIPYYFNYMLNAGASERGWYAFDWGGWRVLGLNSEAMARDADHQLSPIGVEQLAWMERELQQYAKGRCVLTCGGSRKSICGQAGTGNNGRGIFSADAELYPSNEFPIAPIPEPASLLLFGTGLSGIAAWRRRRARQRDSA